MLNSIYKAMLNYIRTTILKRPLKSLLVYLLGRKIKKEKVNKILPKEV